MQGRSARALCYSTAGGPLMGREVLLHRAVDKGQQEGVFAFDVGTNEGFEGDQVRVDLEALLVRRRAALEDRDVLIEHQRDASDLVVLEAHQLRRPRRARYLV